MKTAVIRTVASVACVGAVSLVSGSAGATRQFTDFMDRVYPEWKWADSQGNETTLRMGLRSSCSGPLVGESFQVTQCSFTEARSSVGGKAVTAQWKFVSGEGHAPIRGEKLATRTDMKLAVRLIAGDGSFDCTSKPFAASFGGELGNVDKSPLFEGTEQLLRVETGLIFNETTTCRVGTVKSLGEIFNKLIDFKKPSLRGW